MPARNEAAGIHRALTAILASADAAARTRPGLIADVVCIADACTDETALIARGLAEEDPRVRVLEVDCRVVGLVRAAGCEALLGGSTDTGSTTAEAACAVAPSDLWIASTDADSVVPRHWAEEHLRAAEAGEDMLVGTVAPDPAGASPELIAAWHRLHPLGEGHDCVFGANLGFRGSAYRAAGGFPGLSAGEDEALVAAFEAMGARIRRSDAARVVTSARRSGRVSRGFSTYLDRLAEESAAGAA